MASPRCCSSAAPAVGDPNAGQTVNLESITAVVLGGTSLFGGRGSVLGTLVGSLIVGVFRNGLLLMGLPPISQVLITGILVILAGRSTRSRGGRNGERTRPVSLPVLEARGLVKRYGHVTALDGADFDLLPGEILAVIGDNGAGKSSLIKALSGALIPDSGQILLDGEPMHFRSPLEARRHGIETVYQDLAVAPAWTSPRTCSWPASYADREFSGSIFSMIDRKRMLARRAATSTISRSASRR